MFFLRVHSVDSEHPLDPKSFFSESDSAKPKITERRGVLQLFRNFSHSSSSSSIQSLSPSCSDCSSLLFVLAVPNYISFDDFIRFCGPHLQQLHNLLFIRNDEMKDRYSVLIQLVDQLATDAFFTNFNSKMFSPGEAEVCHILFLRSVEYLECTEVAGTPPDGCTEIPTCPICLERLDPDISGILTTLCDHSFQCPCVSKWTYMSCQVCRFCQQQDEKPTCFVCGTLDDSWICMICGFVGCGRYSEGHAIQHWKDTQHSYSLDGKKQQIWDYVGDSYVHRLNQNQSKIDGKLVGMNLHSMSLEGDCGMCECPEDIGIDGALYNSKVEAIVDDYNRLLTSQPLTRRQYYKALLAETKSKAKSSIPEAVEKAVTSGMQDILNELEKCTEERKATDEINQKLTKNQQIWQDRVKEVEKCGAASAKIINKLKSDLEENVTKIRDTKLQIQKLQKIIGKMPDSGGIKDGTVLPVAYEQSSPANSKRNRKSGRRRK